MRKPVHFEQSIQELQTIVTQLEEGSLSLEESLKQFERGIGLVTLCQKILTDAEQKIQLLEASRVSSEPRDE